VIEVLQISRGGSGGVTGAKILGSVMPNAQVEVIENMGHLPMIERPKEMAEIYLRFLKAD